MSTINNDGNDQDVYNSLIHAYPRITIEQLEAAIADEKANKNRSTRIKHIEQAIRRKKAGKTTFKG